MKTNETQMKVYVVIGGYGAYGGEMDSLRLFDCRSTAVAYHKELTEVEGYDYALMREQDVIMESAIAA
jgi:hypothetical protein